jgi:tetratricopeptide (TPR) repeat protein
MDEMERLLRRVIELKPNHHHAYNALGYSLAERKLRLPEARTLIQKALELSPGEPFITDSLGWVEYRMGNREEAIRILRTAYQARPDPEIAAHLGEVLWTAGQTEEARKIWREAARATRATTCFGRRSPGSGSTCDPARRRAALRARFLPMTRLLASLLAASPLPAAPASSRRRPSPEATRSPAASASASIRPARRRRDRSPRPSTCAASAEAGTLGLSTPLGSMLAEARWRPARSSS